MEDIFNAICSTGKIPLLLSLENPLALSEIGGHEHKPVLLWHVPPFKQGTLMKGREREKRECVCVCEGCNRLYFLHI